MRAPWISSFSFGFFLILFLSSIAAQVYYHPNTANLSTTWTNDASSIPSSYFTDGSKIRIILEEDSFACGFFCNGACTSYLFAILIVTPDFHQEEETDGPAIIWSANRDNPVTEGAILNFTADGDLVLKDVDGSIVWATNTTRKSVAGMKLDDNGSLMMFDGHNSSVWLSFDHPTDCLVPGQKLFQGQKLIPSVSSTDWTAQKDLFSLWVTNDGLFLYVGSNPPHVYYSSLIDGTSYVMFNKCGDFLSFSSIGTNNWMNIGETPEFPPYYIKLMPDGHFKAFGGTSPQGRLLIADILISQNCYPLSCGRNGICSGLDDQQCICPMSSSSPRTDYFKPVDIHQPNKGCFPVTPLTCNTTQDQHFIEVNVTYFTDITHMEGVDVETCKQACLNTCSCKAALFKYYGSDSPYGYCDLPSELFTMTSFDENGGVHAASAFIKVQNGTSTPLYNISRTLDPSRKKKNQITTVIGPIVGSLVFIVILVVGFTKFILRKKKTISEIEEEYLDQVSGMPTRFSYEELKTATNNFNKKLGEGGFGSVFQGTLEDGSRIAVKCLQGLVHVKKSFLAEVESIGSIHHVNLVRLRGFCAWKSERLLVYEFMSNGSLDQWIYSGGDRKHVLGWECRKKIILDIAKGLAYLHEDCRQKIIHLDIKPQNILLDEDFNAKVADFGLSKFIDRDQSQVMTKMRGTPGYMAPEWLSSIITAKVDVYSFGILLLEILCGRKIFDRYQQEDSWHLLCVFQRCWEHGTLLNIVKYSEDMDEHGTEVMEMMKVASWCLQTDFTKRPSMSTVIKVLEGIISVEPNLDYNFSYPRLQETINELEKSSKPMLPSILSGPR